MQEETDGCLFDDDGSGIRYLNTDLDLESADDLSLLATALDARDIFPLHAERVEDGLFIARFETNDTFDEPEANLLAFLAAIDSLYVPERVVWDSCRVRMFDIGIRSGIEPQWVQQTISSQTLRRIADVGADLRITLYPFEPTKSNVTEGL
jgi:hypothetical protein